MWDDGYTSEVDYIHGYFGELSPVRLKLALLSRGVRHAVGPSPAYLELGFGQGLSLAINAATSSGHFYGTDFNPAQVANATELASASGREVTLFEDSFDQLRRRDDLPRFDVIALHGIWSWISPGSREAIVQLARERLRAGGILYISYNVTPGWSPVVPLRHLLDQYARRVATGPLVGRINQAIGFVERMIAADARYFAQYPDLPRRLAAMHEQDRTYLAHEYFNRDWQPMSFVEASDALAEAKLDFAASAAILDNLEGIATPASARQLLGELGDETLRQFARDYVVNAQFRRDVFVKGARTLSRAEYVECTAEQPFLLVGNPAAPPAKIATGAGEADLIPDIYAPIVAAIAERPDEPVTLARLIAERALPNLSRDQIWEALLVLTGAGFLAPVSDSETPVDDLRAAASLNADICRRAAHSGSIQFLAAPAIGAALPVGRIDQLFLLARSRRTEDVVGFVHGVLAAQGEYLLADDEPVTDEARGRALLSDLYRDFVADRLPLLRRVGAA